MGDRANIVIQTGGERVYLYTHWAGHEMPEIVQTALRRKQRWNDPSYLARIVFCTMVHGKESEETGFGISAALGDNEYPICVLDCDKLVVSFEADPNKSWITHPAIGNEFSFEEYCALSDLRWESLGLPESA